MMRIFYHTTLFRFSFQGPPGHQGHMGEKGPSGPKVSEQTEKREKFKAEFSVKNILLTALLTPSTENEDELIVQFYFQNPEVE